MRLSASNRRFLQAFETMLVWTPSSSIILALVGSTDKFSCLLGLCFPFCKEEMLPVSEAGEECEVSHCIKFPRLYLNQNAEF